MKSTQKMYLLIGFLCLWSGSVFTQKLKSSKSSYILSFSTLFSSNLLDLSPNGYDNLYLITSDEDIQIDKLMCALSKENYTSLMSIFDTINLHFKVYTIVKDTSQNINEVTQFLMNSYYYMGYLFELNDTIKKYSSVKGYIIRRNTLQKKIWYNVLKNDCKDDFPDGCKVIIKKIQ
jgi:hypothetical protein